MEKKEKSSSGMKRFWLLVGIIMLMIGIILEVWIGNYYSLALVIPIMYLNNLRRTL